MPTATQSQLSIGTELCAVFRPHQHRKIYRVLVSWKGGLFNAYHGLVSAHRSGAMPLPNSAAGGTHRFSAITAMLHRAQRGSLVTTGGWTRRNDPRQLAHDQGATLCLHTVHMCSIVSERSWHFPHCHPGRGGS